MTSAETVREQRPVALLTGLFVGFASVCLTMGVFWPFAPLFPAMVAGIATLVPVLSQDGQLGPACSAARRCLQADGTNVPT